MICIPHVTYYINDIEEWKFILKNQSAMINIQQHIQLLSLQKLFANVTISHV